MDGLSVSPSTVAPGTLLERTLASRPAIVFIPIVDLRGEERQLFAMEAIAGGPAGTALEEPAAWLAEVRRCHAEARADRAALSAAVSTARLPNGAALSIRVHATTLESDAAFPNFVAEVCEAGELPLSRLIVGISYQPRFTDEGAFFAAVEQLRALGVRIALDDVGAGGLRQRLLVELRAEFYKLDPALLRGGAGRPRALAIVESLAQRIAASGGRIIAQGIETESDLETVTDAGVDLLSGPDLLRSASPPSSWASPEPAGVLPQFPCDGTGR